MTAQRVYEAVLADLPDLAAVLRFTRIGFRMSISNGSSLAMADRLFMRNEQQTAGEPCMQFDNMIMLNHAAGGDANLVNDGAGLARVSLASSTHYRFLERPPLCPVAMDDRSSLKSQTPCVFALRC